MYFKRIKLVGCVKVNIRSTKAAKVHQKMNETQIDNEYGDCDECDDELLIASGAPARSSRRSPRRRRGARGVAARVL